MNNFIMDLIVTSDNMRQAWKQVKRNGGSPGVDDITIDQFPNYLKNRWPKIRRALLEGYYTPSPVLRVEIPKKSGGKRMLGIPTILDRVIQQAIAQILNPIFDSDFSESSHGFRPGRSAHGAVKQVNGHIKSGKRYAVDLDMEKFFDTVNHDILMSLVGRKIRDKVLLKLIGRYLRAGIRGRDGKLYKTTLGTPQGGPLSPLLSNILLDQFDKEMERKGLSFSRYADDAVIMAESMEEGYKVLSYVTHFLQSKLKLRVNKEKSRVVSINECQFLGFTFKGKQIRWTDKSFHDFKQNIRKLTGRSWGVSMEYRISKLNEYIRGWIGYYGISQYYRPIQDIDGWIRRRLRMCFWKQWKRCRTKINNLIKLGIPITSAIYAGRCSHSYWKMSKTFPTNAGMSDAMFKRMGLNNVKDLWYKTQVRHGFR